MKNFTQFHPKSFNIWLVLCKPNLEKHCLALTEVNTRKKKKKPHSKQEYLKQSLGVASGAGDRRSGTDLHWCFAFGFFFLMLFYIIGFLKPWECVNLTVFKNK